MVAAAALCCLATLGCEDPASDPGDEIVFGGVRDTYPCAADGSQFSARITNDDDWEKFHFSGCSEVRDLVLLGDLADFGGRAPVPVLVLGDLIVRGTQLEALSKTDDLGRCAGLCDVLGVQGRLRVVGNPHLVRAELPSVRAVGGVRIAGNPQLTHVTIHPGAGGFGPMKIEDNARLEQAVVRGAPVDDVRIVGNGAADGAGWRLTLLTEGKAPVVMGSWVVEHNPGLTEITWDAPDAEIRLRGLVATGNPRLAGISLPTLRRVEGRVAVHDNPALERLASAASLQTPSFVVEGDLRVGRSGTRHDPLILDLPVRRVGERLVIRDIRAPMTLRFPHLETIGGGLEIGDNAKLDQLDLPHLTQVADHLTSGGGIFVGANVDGQPAPNPALKILRMPALRRVGVGGPSGEGHALGDGDVALIMDDATEVLIGGDDRAEDAALAVYGDLRVEGVEARRGLRLTQLREVGRVSKGLSYGGSLDIPWSQLDAPLSHLTTVRGALTAPPLPDLTALGLSRLQEIGGRPAALGPHLGLVLRGAEVASVVGAFPALTSVGALSVDGTSIRDLDFPALERVVGDVEIVANRVLEEISMPALAKVGGVLKLQANGGALMANQYLFLHPITGPEGLCTGEPAEDPAWCAICAQDRPPNWCASEGRRGGAGLPALRRAGRIVLDNNRSDDVAGGLPWCFADLFARTRLPGVPAETIRNHEPPPQERMPCNDLQVNTCRDGALRLGPLGTPEVCDGTVNCGEDADCGDGAVCDATTGACYAADAPACACGGVRACGPSCDQVILRCDSCCGNGRVEGPGGERCDGEAAPDGATCGERAGPEREAGTPSCDGACQWDVRTCYGCGDGVVRDADPGREECDGDSDGLTCEALGLGGGVLKCGAPGSPEACQLARGGCFRPCDGLRHYYRFEEESVPWAHDAVTGRRGEVTAGHALFDDESEALIFRTDEDSASLPLDPAGEAGGSLVLWVKPTGEGNLLGGTGWRLFLPPVESQVRVRLQFGEVTMPEEQVIIPLGQWSMLTLAWGPEDLRLYIDDQPVFSGPRGAAPLGAAGPLRLGAHPDFDAASFAGWMDEVGVFGGRLNEQGVATLYRRSVGRAETDSLCDIAVCGDGRVQAPNGFGLHEECDGPIPGEEATCTAPGTLLRGERLHDCKVARIHPLTPSATADEVAPRCGDGVREGLEGCDPPGAPCRALGQSGTCSASCRCMPNASVCGNGAREPGEPCDPPAIDCPPTTACQPTTCTCVPVVASAEAPARPACGNGLVEMGERCDGSACHAGEVCEGCQCVSTARLGAPPCLPEAACSTPGGLCGESPPVAEQADWNGDGRCDGWTRDAWPTCSNDCACLAPPPPSCCWSGTPGCPPSPGPDSGDDSPPQAECPEDPGSHACEPDATHVRCTYGDECPDLVYEARCVDGCAICPALSCDTGAAP